MILPPKPSRRLPRPGARPRVASVGRMTTLSPGDIAPDFTLPDPDGTEVSLSSKRGRKVVLYFYPAASTPGCTTQACDFRDNIASLQGAGYEVLGISPDSQNNQRKFRDEEHVPYPLLCDPSRKVLEAYGAYGEKKLYGKTVTGVIRSTFVIDEQGTVEKAMYNVKATGHVAKLRKDLGLD
jgi:peroxiredoxin Q/BCP